MDQLFNKKRYYNQVVLYRHVNPDLDAYGSQLGLYWVIKTYLPDINVVLAGDMSNDLLKLFPSFEVGEFKKGPTLGIVLDTANRERIDGDISVCDKILKIDHHIVVDSYGDMNIEHESASSCSEIVTLLLKESYIDLPIEAANALYLGIVGDSNRFLYKTTTKKTFKAVSCLLDAGVQIEALYEKLYLRPLSQLQITQFIYNNYHLEDGVAWYYLSQEDLKTLHITRDQGSQFVNTLSNFEEIKIWLAVTENVVDNNYRVSIRSRGITINDVASEFRGGGHANASGATLLSLDELDDLIRRLKEKING